MTTQRVNIVNVWVLGKVYAIDTIHREILIETSGGQRGIIQPGRFDDQEAVRLMGRLVYAEGMRGAGLPLIAQARIQELSRADDAGSELFAAAPDRQPGEGE